MDQKATFLNSLSDEQLGIFYAHEYDSNLDDLLEDYITPIQYNLFTNWKNSEGVVADEPSPTPEKPDSIELYMLLSKIDAITSMLTSMTTRMDNLEARLNLSERSQVYNKANAEDYVNNEMEEFIEVVDTNHLTTVTNEKENHQFEEAMDERITDLEVKLEAQITKHNEINEAKFLDVEKRMRETAKELAQLRADQQRLETNVVADTRKSCREVDCNLANTRSLLNGQILMMDVRIGTVNEQLAVLEPSFDCEKTAKQWLQSLQEQWKDPMLTNEKKEELSSKENIKKLLSALKKFQQNEEIERTATQITLEISNAGQRGTLNKVINERITYYRTSKELIRHNVFWMFLKISCNRQIRKKLLKESHFDLFLLPFSDDEFSKYNVLAGNILSNLLSASDSDWKNLTKKSIDDALYDNIGNWQLAKYNPFYTYSFKTVLKDFSIYTRSQQRFWSWIIANHLMLEHARYADMLKKEGAVPILEKITADSATDPEVVKLLKISLDILKKKSSKFLWLF